MILIISQAYDNATSYIEEWLLHLGKQVTVVSDYNRIKSICYQISKEGKVSFRIGLSNGNTLNLDSIRAVWYRKGTLLFEDKLPDTNDQLSKVIIEHIENEWLTLREAVILAVQEKFHIGNYFRRIPNKLETLRIAAQTGWDIPFTLVSSNRNEVVNHFIRKNIIVKNIQDTLSTNDGHSLIYQRTKEIKSEELPATFSPSLFQEKIEKKYELRVFFLNGKCYSMAIFSQQDDQTATDFREYNHQHMNRYVPYKLADELESKAIKFMNSMGLNSGSIDIVVTPDERFVFLEVNPNGQFGFVNSACNYHLNKKIALELLNYE